MARPLRIEYEGAWYHVMNRGAGGKNIFYNNEHRNFFLIFLEKISCRYKIANTRLLPNEKSLPRIDTHSFSQSAQMHALS